MYYDLEQMNKELCESILEIEQENARLKRDMEAIKQSRDRIMEENANLTDLCNRQAKQLKRTSGDKNA